MPVGRESGASTHSEAGIGEPVGQDDFGVLAAHGQQSSTERVVEQRMVWKVMSSMPQPAADAGRPAEMRKEAVSRPTQTVRVLPLWVLV